MSTDALDVRVGSELPAEVVDLLAAQEGVALTRQLLSLGRSRDEVHRWTRTGRLHRPRRGLLIDGAVWRACASWDRHGLRARVYWLEADLAGRALALSHHSSLALQAIAVLDEAVDDLAHMCAVGQGRGHRSAGLFVHAGLAGQHVMELGSFRVVVPALACLQVAADYGIAAGLVAVDSALNQKLCTRTDLDELAEHPQLRVGGRRVKAVLDLADGRRESAGESRTAWVWHRLGLPELVPQVVILDVDGTFVARVDFVVKGTRVIVEFDGADKYDGRASLLAEKRREDRLRELGYEVVRITWADLGRPTTVLAKARSALERARARV